MFQALKSIGSKIKHISTETWLVIGLLLISSIAHTQNMFHYPYFENDEATYVSQAWSFVSQGKLAPYTYYYDHAPVGWMFLGLWYVFTGGLTTFGANPLISGRIFIFILHMASVVLLYVITKRITRQKLAAALAVIVFALSPLELYYGRRVLLDNIMVFWMLLSLFFATKTPQKLRHVIASALAFGIAVLSKENALFVGPVILYIVWMYSTRKTRTWSTVQWLTSFASLVILYPLYALLKGELFPGNFLSPAGSDHVSLIETLFLQASRGNGILPWEQGSDFYGNLMVWMQKDTWIIGIGTLALMSSMILNQKYREIKVIALTAIAQIIFLARGALVFDFYILGVLPLLSMTIGIMIARPVLWAKNHISPVGYGLIAALSLALIFVTSGTPAFSRDETTNQQQAIDWIVANLPQDARIAINNYAFPQLKFVEGYSNVDFSFKLQYDPSIQQGIYQSSPYNLDYLLVGHEEILHMWNQNLPFVQTAFDHSQLIADFTTNTTSYIDIEKLISTNGDWAQIYRLDQPDSTTQTHAWRQYKKRFIEDDGQVIDLSTWTTTSEGQSYALLRALENKDKVTFDSVWNWTQENLQVRDQDKLFAWRVTLDEAGLNHVSDTNAATDADQDIAYALYQAYILWNEYHYLDESKAIIADIWKHEVVHRDNKYYLISAPEHANGRRLLINPSYIAPAYYRTFSLIDTNNWTQLIHDSYALINGIQSLSDVSLVSNWIHVEPDNSFSSASALITQGADLYGYDAFRFAWRMYQDKNDLRAQNNLAQLSKFYTNSWEKHGYIAASYDQHGEPASDFSDIATSAGAVIALSTTNQELAQEIFNHEIAAKLDPSTYIFGDKDNYYAQNWGAFALQILEEPKPNLTALISEE